MRIPFMESGPRWQPGMAQRDWSRRPTRANSADWSGDGTCSGAAEGGCRAGGSSAPAATIVRGARDRRTATRRLIVLRTLIDPVPDGLDVCRQQARRPERHLKAAVADRSDRTRVAGGAHRRLLSVFELFDQVAAVAVEWRDPRERGGL